MSKIQFSDIRLFCRKYTVSTLLDAKEFKIFENIYIFFEGDRFSVFFHWRTFRVTRLRSRAAGSQIASTLLLGATPSSAFYLNAISICSANFLSQRGQSPVSRKISSSEWVSVNTKNKSPVYLLDSIGITSSRSCVQDSVSETDQFPLYTRTTVPVKWRSDLAGCLSRVTWSSVTQTRITWSYRSRWALVSTTVPPKRHPSDGKDLHPSQRSMAVPSSIMCSFIISCSRCESRAAVRRTEHLLVGSFFDLHYPVVCNSNPDRGFSGGGDCQRLP